MRVADEVDLVLGLLLDSSVAERVGSLIVHAFTDNLLGLLDSVRGSAELALDLAYFLGAHVLVLVIFIISPVLFLLTVFLEDLEC